MFLAVSWDITIWELEALSIPLVKLIIASSSFSAGMIKFSISFSIRGIVSSFLLKVQAFVLRPFLPCLLLVGNEDDPGLASIKRRVDSCFSWRKYWLVDYVKMCGSEADLRKRVVRNFALRVWALETRLTSINGKRLLENETLAK